MSNIKEIGHLLTPGAVVTGRMINGAFEYRSIDGIAVGAPRAIGVRAVLAGAYRGDSLKRQGPLTHAVAVDPRGEEGGPLCGKVHVNHLCDVAESGPPTCPTCARRAVR